MRSRFGAVGTGAVAEVGTRAPQLPLIIRPRQHHQDVFQRAELQVVALHPRRRDGLGRTTGDLTVTPRRTDLRQQLAHLTRSDRTACLALTHPRMPAEPRGSRRRTVHRADPPLGARPRPAARTRPRADRSPHDAGSARPAISASLMRFGSTATRGEPSNVATTGTSSHTHAEQAANRRNGWCGSGRRSTRGSTCIIPEHTFAVNEFVRKISTNSCACQPVDARQRTAQDHRVVARRSRPAARR